VLFPNTTVNSYSYSSAPILDDIENCNLPQISWVTPDEAWSDHPGDVNLSNMGHDWGYGPSWVADILNAIGNSATQSKNGGVCDYWGTSTTPGISVEPTAIFITWDDWGGFFDHVPPPAVLRGSDQNGGTCQQMVDLYTYTWGCGYVYGFRVPLLVASEYTPKGYVSGFTLSPVGYPPPPEYTHDFGSILAFIENNFSLGPIAPQVNGYTYADQNSLDYYWCGKGTICTPLWDFFGDYYNNPITTQSFVNISPLSNPYSGGKPENACFFQCFYPNSNGNNNTNNCYPTNQPPGCPASGTCDNGLGGDSCGPTGPDEGATDND
jgi:hypothetical protein